MKLDDAINGVLRTRELLRNTKGITDPAYISEQMQRLTQYVGAVEEHLAELEEELEVTEHESFTKWCKEKTVNQAQILSKDEVSSQKGKIAKLKRYVDSSWKIIGVAQSRVNHLASEYKLGGKL